MIAPSRQTGFQVSRVHSQAIQTSQWSSARRLQPPTIQSSEQFQHTTYSRNAFIAECNPNILAKEWEPAWPSGSTLGINSEALTTNSALAHHFDPAKNECDPKALSAKLGIKHLWLAPKLADGAEWPADLIPLAEGFVHDAHAKDAFGGTGKVSDWTRFQQLQQKYPKSLWILAGGLGPDNIAAAANSGAGFFDLNSGIELAPGLKSAEKMTGVSEVLLKNSQS